MPVYVTVTGSSRSVGVRVPGVAEVEAPANLAAAAADGGSLVDDDYFYAVTSLGLDGESVVSTEDSATTSSTDNSVELTWDEAIGAEAYRVYKGTATGTYTEYFEVADPEYLDDGTAGTAGTPPAESTAIVDGGWINIKAGVYATVDVDSSAVRKALNHHRSVGQYYVAAANNEYLDQSGSVATLPSNS